MSRCIDAIVMKGSKYRSVEHKLHNWKKALKQVRTHQHGADKSYICMPVPARGYADEFIQELKDRGIGLISYDGENFNLEIRAKQNEHWKPARDSFIRFTQKVLMS